MGKIGRRSLLTGALGATAVAMADPQIGTISKKAPRVRPRLEDLDRAVALPVLKTERLKSPVIIESIQLLKRDKDYLVHVRSKDGAEGISVTNPPRAQYVDHIFEQLVAPFFIGKDARDLDSLLRGLYRWNSNYKMYGLALWSAQAWAEFAILDMLGRITNQPLGAMIGDVLRHEVPFYVASGRRDTTPEQEIEFLKHLLAESGAKALKFRVGGRMSDNADAMPDRTERLIPLVRKTFGDAMDIHADANSSYDPKEAIRVGHMLEAIRVVHYEEPCEFDHFEDMKTVADALTVPVACGEQEFSEYRFRWMIANHGADIVQPDLFYYGGMVRSTKVARMAAAAKLPIALHLSGGFCFVYMLHFASATPNLAKYQEYKLGMEKYGGWLDPAITVKDGKMTVPTGPGVGIKDLAGLLKDARPA
jgi:L-alanine-DL-glutamate epimerase-like enolase superfamily enzyme